MRLKSMQQLTCVVVSLSLLQEEGKDCNLIKQDEVQKNYLAFLPELEVIAIVKIPWTHVVRKPIFMLQADTTQQLIRGSQCSRLYELSAILLRYRTNI